MLHPPGPAYATVRAPIAAGGGHAWFANRGVGRAVPQSLADTMTWFRSWLAEIARCWATRARGGIQRRGDVRRRSHPAGSGPLLRCGDPQRDAAVGPLRNAVVGRPARPPPDGWRPDRTWQYLHPEAGADTRGVGRPGGPALSRASLEKLGDLLTRILCRQEA